MENLVEFLNANDGVWGFLGLALTVGGIAVVRYRKLPQSVQLVLLCVGMFCWSAAATFYLIQNPIKFRADSHLPHAEAKNPAENPPREFRPATFDEDIVNGRLGRWYGSGTNRHFGYYLPLHTDENGREIKGKYVWENGKPKFYPTDG